jgi:hypothetical protein
MNDSVHVTAESRRSEFSKCSTTYVQQTIETKCKVCQLRITEKNRKISGRNREPANDCVIGYFIQSYLYISTPEYKTSLEGKCRLHHSTVHTFPIRVPFYSVCLTDRDTHLTQKRNRTS